MNMDFDLIQFKKSFVQLNWAWHSIYLGEISPFLENMGEAKRRKELGLPPRDKKAKKNVKKVGFISNLSAKYPFLPFILGGVLLTVLIVDLLNYYK